MTRPKAVLDCNVLLQAFMSEGGPSAELLRRMESSQFDLYLSRAVLGELRAVLQYPAVRDRNPGISDVDIDSFLERLLFRGRLVRRVRHAFDYARARQDEPYIDLCIACRADHLITRDDDLHWLSRGHTPLCKQFRQMTHPLRVIDPVEFLRVLDQLEV